MSPIAKSASETTTSKRMPKTQLFTVIGYYHDTNQRFAGSYRATGWKHAEQIAVRRNNTLVPVAVLPGRISPIDTDDYTRLGASDG